MGRFTEVIAQLRSSRESIIEALTDKLAGKGGDLSDLKFSGIADEIRKIETKKTGALDITLKASFSRTGYSTCNLGFTTVQLKDDTPTHVDNVPPGMLDLTITIPDYTAYGLMGIDRTLDGDKKYLMGDNVIKDGSFKDSLLIEAGKTTTVEYLLYWSAA